MPRVICLGFSGLASAKPPLLMPEALAQEASGDIVLPGAPSNIDSEALNDWLAQPEKPLALVVWPQPHAFLADALAQEASPERALEQWTTIAEQALLLFRRHRRQVVLLGLAPGESLSPAAALPEIWRKAAGHAEAAVQRLPQPGALHRLAAAQLASSAVLQEVLACLQASSHAVSASAGEVVDTVKAALAYQSHQEAEHQRAERECGALASERNDLVQEQSRLEQELHVARDERDSLLAQLHQVQEALEEALQCQQREADQLAEIKEKSSGLGLEIAALHKERDAAQAERALLIDQLHKVQEALEEAQVRQQRDADQMAQLKRQSEALNGQNAELTHARDVSTKTLEVERQRHKAAAQALKNADQALGQLRRETAETRQVDIAARRDAEQQLEAVRQQYSKARTDHEQLKIQLKEVQLALGKALHDQRQQEGLRRETEQRCNALIQERDAVKEEGALLFDQLQKVQEALEEVLQRQQHAAGQLAESRRQYERMNTLLKGAEQRVHELNCLVSWLRAHAYRHAAAAHRNIRSYRKLLPTQCALVAQSGLFDTDWYLERYPDVAQADIPPVEHYVKFGALEGRDPSPRFNTEFYLIEHPDVSESGQHPLLHYLKNGIHEQRRTTPEAAA